MSTTIVSPKGLGAAAMLAVSRGLDVRSGCTAAARGRTMSRSRKARWVVLGVVLQALANPQAGQTALVLDDPLQGSKSNVKVWNLASGTNAVRLNGKSFCDDAGPFLGLGVSYFQALRHAKYDRERLNRNLALFAAKGFNYVRVLSMVSWDGLEIAPVSFTNRAGRVIPAWPDYWQKFRDLLDLIAQHGLRAEVTLFADAQYVMPSNPTRQMHLGNILANIAGREPHILHLEVANEAWQNGFPGAPGIADLRAFTQYLADRTAVPVAITSNDDTSDQGIIALYRGSAADLATVHFSRDTRTVEGGWLPVRDSYRAGDLPGVPPVSSNEPIGPGSSVSSESDPIKLCAAAVFAYLANLPAYVYHSRAGVYGYVRCCPPAGGEDRFEDTAGINAYQHLRQILPPDLAGCWVRNDGLEPAAPFTVFCDGQPNRYWPDVSGPTNGCHRNIGSVKGSEFVCFPMGILGGGVTLEARRPLRCEVFHPLTGGVVSNLTLNAGNRFTLPQGPGAYILKGTVLSRSRGATQVDETRPKPFPHRIWAACDFEGHTPDYGWFGPPETNNIPRYPGNATALGVSARPHQNFSALMTGINPVPGPRMGKVNQIYLRYFLRGGTEATFQHFSLTSEDNNHIRVSGLTEDRWSEVALNFTRDGQRNDGTPGVPFKDGERMDDFKIFVGKPGDGKRYDLVIDDVIFFATDPDLPPEPEPFPNRVIFIAAFDTGTTAAEKPKYWPGEFELVTRDLPAGSYWSAARAVPQKNAKGKWIRLQIAPPRPVGAHTKLRFRYHLTGASQMTVQLFDLTDSDNRHIRLRDLKPGAWQTVYLDFTRDARRNDGRDTRFAAGHLVDDLFFFVEPAGDREVDLFVDDVVLFDAGKP